MNRDQHPEPDPFALMAAATGAIRVVTPPSEPELDAVPFDEGNRTRRRRRLALVAVVVSIALVLGSGGLLFLAGPFGFVPETTGNDFRQSVERALEASIESTRGIAVDAVECAVDIQVDRVLDFPCQVFLDDGTQERIMAQLSDGGATVQWAPTR